MEHSFNLSIAKKFGVEEAIIIHNIYFWTLKNKANKRHFYDGNYWIYNSIDAFTELFPYWSRRQIERILKNAVEKGAIIKGNYNKIAYDRTTWYALTETVKSIYANGEMETTERGDGFTQSVEAIPDNKPDNKLPDNKPIKEKEIENLRQSEFFEKLTDYFSQNTEHLKMKVFGFLVARINNGEFEEFKRQTLAYMEYKRLSKETIHRWSGYSADWKQENWIDKLNKIKTQPNATQETKKIYKVL